VDFLAQLSMLGHRWEQRALPEGYVPSSNGIPPIVDEVIARRGFLPAEGWLNPTLRSEMPDPYKIPNMRTALQRLAQAVKGGERISVIGDYDVDGATSCAILIQWWRAAGLEEPIFYIPQRLTEGYGPNNGAIDHLAANGTSLLLIVDSGTTAFEPIAHARSKGLDVIVIDHHDPQEDGTLPNGIIVNPKLEEDGFGYLCTAGLCFLTLVGLARELREANWFTDRGVQEPNLMPMLGLAALGTVADMVPLIGLNRAYVTTGLRRMSENIGLAALIAENSLEDFATPRAAGFVLGPCINAGGRIGDTRQGTRLLTARESHEAKALAQDLLAQNLERRAIEKAIVAQCIDNGALQIAAEKRILVLHDPTWHPGVVGLGAARAKDFFDVSVVVIGEDGKGSGRSVPGFHIGRAFMKAAAAGLIKKGGGHAAAGGLTADVSKIDDLRSFLEGEANGAEHLPVKIDLIRGIGEISMGDILDLDRLAPFGMGNPKPRVVVTGGTLRALRIIKDAHVQAKLVAPGVQIGMILFNGAKTRLGEALQKAEGCAVHVLGCLRVNEHLGHAKLQIEPEDLMIVGAERQAEGVWENVLSI